MHLQLINYINKHQLIAKDDKVLLAVSGGIDSVLMCYLFVQAEISFGMAHCNFNLRGEESDGDQAFVEALAKQLNVPLFLKDCDTKGYAKAHKISIQMAARDLRFAWFDALCEKEDYAVYATAHHIDDAIETYFINQLRGTGIAGLHGLLPKNGKLIHPLLFANRQEIIAYCKQNKISYREDSSNASTKYLRNSLRHNVMPVLEELQPAYRNILMQNMDRFSVVENIYLQKVEEEKQKLCKCTGESLIISIPLLVSLSDSSTYLYEFIKDFGFSFSQAQEIVDSIEHGQVGAIFSNEKYDLLRDRETLIISENTNKAEDQCFIDLHNKELNFPIFLQWETIGGSYFEADENKAFLDFDKLQFPLKIRKWEQGDYFHPLGMQGKKLISDFFIDIKLNRFEKENIWLLLSGNDIVWVIGKRVDHRFRVLKNTKKTFKLQLKD